MRAGFAETEKPTQDAIAPGTDDDDAFDDELSDGQRQRASLARDLALDPKLLIASDRPGAEDGVIDHTGRPPSERSRAI